MKQNLEVLCKKTYDGHCIQILGVADINSLKHIIMKNNAWELTNR